MTRKKTFNKTLTTPVGKSPSVFDDPKLLRKRFKRRKGGGCGCGGAPVGGVSDKRKRDNID